MSFVSNYPLINKLDSVLLIIYKVESYFFYNDVSKDEVGRSPGNVNNKRTDLIRRKMG